MDFDQYFEFSTLSGKSVCRVSAEQWVDLRSSEVCPEVHSAEVVSIVDFFDLHCTHLEKK